MAGSGSPSPVCISSLMAADFARLDDHHSLGTPSLGLVLGGDVGTQLGSPHIASPALAGWTPRLSVKDMQPQDCEMAVPSLRAIQCVVPAVRSGSVGDGALVLPIAPLSTLSMPELLQANFMLPMPQNIRQHAASMQIEEELCLVTMPPVPQTGSASSGPTCVVPARPHPHPILHAPPLPPMVPAAEPAASAGSGLSGGGHSSAAAGSTHSGGSICAPAAFLSPAMQAAVSPAATSSGAAQAEVDCRREQGTQEQQQQQVQVQAHVQQGGSSDECVYAGSGMDGGGGGGAAFADEQADQRLSLEFLEEHGYFDMPIQQAAAELHVGVTTLKKVCRVNSIERWPFRKRSSLNRLIEKTREYFATDPEQCTEALAQLEAQRNVLQAQQGEDIPEQVKRYRQAIFKLDYKVKKIAKERRTHRGAAAAHLAALDKAHTIRQLGVGTPANSILGILCESDMEPRFSSEREMRYEMEEDGEEEEA